ncbi:MAG: transposase [Moraxellaceae bacterium]|nr:transposase [Moraxellaceae bacterium]
MLHHQRMRFGTKSEAFNTPQQDLLPKTVKAADEADSATAGVAEQTQPQNPPKPNVPCGSSSLARPFNAH